MKTTPSQNAGSDYRWLGWRLTIDTQGARSALLEMVVLASDLAVSPLEPTMLSAREFTRGTVQMLESLRAYARLGLHIPPVSVLVSSLDLSTDAREVHEAVRDSFEETAGIRVAKTTIPASVIFPRASKFGVPAHRLEYRQPGNRKSPSALKVIRDLAIELFPEWADRFEAMTEEVVHGIVKGSTGK